MKLVPLPISNSFIYGALLRLMCYASLLGKILYSFQCIWFSQLMFKFGVPKLSNLFLPCLLRSVSILWICEFFTVTASSRTRTGDKHLDNRLISNFNQNWSNARNQVKNPPGEGNYLKFTLGKRKVPRGKVCITGIITSLFTPTVFFSFFFLKDKGPSRNK